MAYFVTFDARGADAAESGSSKPMELADALAHACRLLDEGKRNVVIKDDRNSISGDELAACCRGDKEITADLKAVVV
jgi:hypothetical protein